MCVIIYTRLQDHEINIIFFLSYQWESNCFLLSILTVFPSPYLVETEIYLTGLLNHNETKLNNILLSHGKILVFHTIWLLQVMSFVLALSYLFTFVLH